MRGSHDEEAFVGWVWTAVTVWVVLDVPVAVLVGRVIRRADREELEASVDVPLPRATPPSDSATT